jgi:hypothetical protein
MGDGSFRDGSAFGTSLVSSRGEERSDRAGEAGRSFNSFHPILLEGSLRDPGVIVSLVDVREILLLRAVPA